MTLICVSAAPPSAQSSYCGVNWLRNGKVLGHHINAKISPKVASEKVQTTVSENRCIYPRMGFFRQSFMILFVSTLAVQSNNNCRILPSNVMSWWWFNACSDVQGSSSVSALLCSLILSCNDRPVYKVDGCLSVKVNENVNRQDRGYFWFQGWGFL